MLFIVMPFTANEVPEKPEPGFDTTAIKGYSFYRAYSVPVNELSDTALFNTVYSFIGIPHRSKAGARGIDCSGLVKRVFGKAYGAQLSGSSRDLLRNSQKISRRELMEGDLLFFKLESNQVNHVGIYLGNGKFVHSSSSAGVTINDTSEVYYQKRLYQAGRFMVTRAGSEMNIRN